MAWPDENDLEDYLHRTFTGDETAMAQLAINAAIGIVRAWTHQYLEEVTAESVVLDGNGRDVMILPEYPVSDVSNVVIEDVTFDGTDDNYLRWSESGLIYRVDGGTFPDGIKNITVTYNHGYAASDEMWDVIKAVVCSVAGRLFEQGGVASENTGGYSTTYEATGPGLTEMEMMALSPYRSKVA